MAWSSSYPDRRLPLPVRRDCSSTRKGDANWKLREGGEASVNRLIKENDLNMMYVIGPGHGGPGLVAHTYLEGSYTERYPAIERNRNGLQRLFRQFSWPYGIPSHVSPETPGSIHEGGELGYSLIHAFGAAFDNPDLIVACVIGDGEAETGALAASWHSNKFLNPA